MDTTPVYNFGAKVLAYGIKLSTSIIVLNLSTLLVQ